MKQNRYHTSSHPDPLTVIDHMSTSRALQLGLITEEENEAILNAFISRMTTAFRTKGFATEEDVHPVPYSEMIKQFRKSVSHEKANGGIAKFMFP